MEGLYEDLANYYVFEACVAAERVCAVGFE